MKQTRATYVVAEGTTVLEGRAVAAGNPIAMTPGQALYHVSLGRLKPAETSKTKAKAKTASSDDKMPPRRSSGDSSESSAD